MYSKIMASVLHVDAMDVCMVGDACMQAQVYELASLIISE